MSSCIMLTRTYNGVKDYIIYGKNVHKLIQCYSYAHDHYVIVKYIILVNCIDLYMGS